ncbi:NACHT, LRR and PYD domains-containing protein 3-like [Megalops cyprinoides]|uniref:NACHT, LRR and PYD domains-containing protein 3-like n=1 Tax=Megalops cyprinoides TaxID=118141 RepID=UPI00186546C2|nr:NACHT, LRR and PYD domains-containing protein 3-like [Megalops cyprinoides]
MELVRSEYSMVEEYNSLVGEDVRLDERYTKLLMIQTHRKVNERMEELCFRGSRFQNVLKKRDSPEFRSTSLANLFDPDPQGNIRRTVILQGQAGMGKSFTALKIMSDWASGKLYSDRFQYIFLLKCRQLNLISKNVSLADLILDCSPSLEPAIPHILSCPDQILFILDGFDELNLSLGAKEPSAHEPNEKCSIEVILSSLLQQKILSKSFLLITTRSNVIERLKKVVKNPQFTEILGFSEKGIEEYVQKFFKNERQAEQACKYVRGSRSVFTTCFIPVTCWIVCTVLREHFEEGTDIKHALETTTSIFVYFVHIVLKHHYQRSSLPAQELLQCLGNLAKRGLFQKQILFDQKAVKDAFPEGSHIPSSFLNKILLKKMISCQTVYSFTHLSFQEFFTALSYVLCDEEEAKANVAEVLKDSSTISILDGWNCWNPVVSTLPFLFGLFNQKTRVFLQEEFNLSISTAVQSQLQDWLKERPQPDVMSLQLDARSQSDNVLHCLYEMHSNDLVREVMQSSTSIALSENSAQRADSWVVSYCLQYCRRIESLDLSECGFTPKDLEILLSVLPRCESLRLDVRSVGNEGVKILNSALKCQDCRIQTLSLNRSGLTDAAVGDLCSAVRGMTKLTCFRMDFDELSDDKVEDVFSALGTRQTLSVVKLVMNSITERKASILAHFILSCNSLKEIQFDAYDHSCKCDGDEEDDPYYHAFGPDWDLSVTMLRPDLPEQEVKMMVEVVENSGANLLCGALLGAGFSIQRCRMRITDKKDLCSAVSLRQTVTEMELQLLPLTEELPQLLSFLQNCHSLETLAYDPRQIYDSDEQTCYLLSPFDANDVSVIDEGLEKLLPALSSIPSLSTMKLFGEFFTEKRASILNELARSCPNLRNIELQRNSSYSPGKAAVWGILHPPSRSAGGHPLLMLLKDYPTLHVSVFHEIMEKAHFVLDKFGFFFMNLDCKDITDLDLNLRIHQFIDTFVCSESDLSAEKMLHLGAFLQKSTNLKIFK